MSRCAPIPEPLWDTVPAEAQVPIRALLAGIERRIADLEERVNKNSSNSSKPPSSDHPSVKRRPPARPSGKKRGGQPGHRHHPRALVPPEQVRQVIEFRPEDAAGAATRCTATIPSRSDTRSPRCRRSSPMVDEYRLHRLAAPAAAPRPVRPCRRACPAGAFGPRLRADPQCPGRGLSPGQAAGPATGLRSARPDDLRGEDLPTGAAVRRRTGGPGRGAAGVRPGGRRGPHRRDLVVAGAGQGVALGGRDPAGDRLHDRPVAWGRRRQDMLGTTAGKVVISDRFTSYAWIKRRQFCWAHLDRDFQAMIDRGGESAEVGRLLAGPFRTAVRLVAPGPGRDDGPGHASDPRCDVMRFSFREDLRRGVKCGCARTAATCRELLAGETAPVDVRASRGGRADEQRRRAGVAARRDRPRDSAAAPTARRGVGS